LWMFLDMAIEKRLATGMAWEQAFREARLKAGSFEIARENEHFPGNRSCYFHAS
jgi:hypothetical protein